VVGAATSHVFAAAAATSHVFAAAAQVLLSRCLGGGLDAGCGVGYAVLKPRVGCAVLKVPVGYEVLKVHVDTSHASYVSCFIRLMLHTSHGAMPAIWAIAPTVISGKRMRAWGAGRQAIGITSSRHHKF